MGGSWFKEEKDPGFLAQNLTYTLDGKIIWQSIEKVYKNMKFLWRFYKLNTALVDEALKNPNKVVLLNVDKGYHWVFLLNKVPLLGYRCVDPYQFPAKVRYYKLSEVVGGTILNRK